MNVFNLFLILSTSWVFLTSCSNGSGDSKKTNDTVIPLSENLVELPTSFDAKGISTLSRGMVLFFKNDVQLIGRINEGKDQSGQPYCSVSVDLFKNQLTKSHSRNCWLDVEVPSADSSSIINFAAGQSFDISGTRTLGDLKQGGGYNGYIEFGRKMTIGCFDYYDHEPVAPEQLAEVTIGELKENFPGKISFAAKK